MIHEVTFQVDTVKTDYEIYPEIEKSSYKNIFTNYLDNKSKLDLDNPFDLIMEAVDETDDHVFNVGCNGFLATCTKAYDLHKPLEIWSDHIKLLIVQAFSIHINENSENFRSKLVCHQDKKQLIVEMDNFSKQGLKNPWTDVFSLFTKKIEEDTADKTLINYILENSQTTTVTTKVALSVSLMDICQKYYDYELHTKCGIPSITLKGSVDDWKKIRRLIEYIANYDFEWYTEKILPMIDEFINAAANNKPNVDFWKNMVKKKGMSGGPFYSGWIINFFPYLLKSGKYIKSIMNDDSRCYITAAMIPDGINFVPFTWKYFDDTYEMFFCSGFIGTVVTENKNLRPAVSWTVAEKKYVVNQDFFDVYRHGTYYCPASKHYEHQYSNPIVNCDMCNKQDISICIGYNKLDLCMLCMEKITSILTKKNSDLYANTNDNIYESD